MQSIKIFVADDHLLVRDNLVTMLDIFGFSVVGEGVNGHQVVERVLKLRPDIVLMDILMPVMNGITATARIFATDDTIKVIALTGVNDGGRLEEMFAAGAVGYVRKASPNALLTRSIEAAYNGQCVHAEPLTCIDFTRRGKSTRSDYDRLSIREREILQLIAEGRSNSEISYLLDIHIRTVKTHRERLMKKLDLHHVGEIVLYCVREGIIAP